MQLISVGFCALAIRLGPFPVANSCTVYTKDIRQIECITRWLCGFSGGRSVHRLCAKDIRWIKCNVFPVGFTPFPAASLCCTECIHRISGGFGALPAGFVPFPAKACAQRICKRYAPGLCLFCWQICAQCIQKISARFDALPTGFAPFLGKVCAQSICKRHPPDLMYYQVIKHVRIAIGNADGIAVGNANRIANGNSNGIADELSLKISVRISMHRVYANDIHRKCGRNSQ